MTTPQRALPHQTTPLGLRLATRLCAAMALATVAAHAQAQAPAHDAWPSKPVTLIVPTAPAGGTDTMARLFADALGKALGQTFIIENRPGANGIVGVDTAARVPPDGYKLLFTYAASIAVNPALYRKLPYEPLRDLTPIVQMGRGGNLMLVRGDLPVKTIGELAAYAKARPNQVSYCSWSIGSGGHLAMESFAKQAGLQLTHVPYKGSSPCMQDLTGGRIDAAFGDTASTMELIKSGRIRALAYSGPSRLPGLPAVPTMNESGYPFAAYSWYGLFGPAQLPPEVVERLNTAVNRLLKDPVMLKKLAELNMTDLVPNTPAQFRSTIQNDLAVWSKLVKEVGVSLE